MPLSFIVKISLPLYEIPNTMAKLNTADIGFEEQICKAADKMRGNIDASEYKSVVLGLIFLKYISDKFEARYNELLAEGEGFEEDKDEYTYKNVFYVPTDARWSVIAAAAHSPEIGVTIDNAMRAIEKENRRLKDILPKNFSRPELDKRRLGDVVDLFTNIKMHEHGDSKDILGRAYEYCLSKFAEAEGKLAGEFYTPQEVSEILAEIVITGKTRLKSVYDPTCGSGSLLLRAAREGNADTIYGQEKNPTTFNLCRMNMLLHGIKYNNFEIHNDDTLERDELGDKQFDAVVANPPFSAEWSAADKFNNDDRFSKAGKLAPKSKADYAFILHMIYHLNDGGTMACVAPHGVLFRGAAEGAIRQFLIEKKNYIDAIIGLPANIFYGTSIPTCILVMKKCRQPDDNILFIDASKEFEKVKTQNKLRPEHIQKIVETYRNRTEIEKYSHLASLQEIKDNDYNLNIPRYVDTFEEEEEIDIKAVMAEIKELEAKRTELDAQIEVYLKELGIVE